MAHAANAMRHVVFPDDKCCCYWCLGVFSFKDLPSHFAECKAPMITPNDRQQRAKQCDTLDAELQYRFTGVKYNEYGCSHLFLCGYCAKDPDKAEKPHLIENITNHWGQCEEAKAVSRREENNKTLMELSGGDVKCTVSVPEKSDKKRPASTTTNNGTKSTAPISKKHKENKSKTKARVLKQIPMNKSSKKTLCVFMTYGAMRKGCTTVEDLLYKHDPRSKINHSLAAPECDLARLTKLEELYSERELKAYTISLKDENISEQHISLNIGQLSKSKDHWFYNLRNNTFDQISFDWVNMPDAYVRSWNIDFLGLLESFALKRIINPAGGAVYLPFKLSYYFAVAGNEEKLKLYYKIDYIDEDIVAEENHLYRGTVALGDEALCFLNVGHIGNDCIRSEHEINGQSDIQLVLPQGVKRHYKKLKEKLENIDDICMIRLQVLPEATIKKNAPRVKTEQE